MPFDFRTSNSWIHNSCISYDVIHNLHIINVRWPSYTSPFIRRTLSLNLDLSAIGRQYFGSRFLLCWWILDMCWHKFIRNLYIPKYIIRNFDKYKFRALNHQSMMNTCKHKDMDSLSLVVLNLIRNSKNYFCLPVGYSWFGSAFSK